MATKIEPAKGFYESRGMVRHMLILSEAHKKKLKLTSKSHQLTQGEFLEVLLDQMDLGHLSPHLAARKAAKTRGASTKTELVKKMKGLSPEQLAAIEAIIGGAQSAR